MPHLPSRQRTLTVLRGGKADRTPWIPLCSGRFFSSLPEYRKFIVDGREAVGQEYTYDALRFRVEFYREIGADYMEWGTPSGYRVVRSKVEMRRTEEDGEVRTEYRTPIGSLTSVWVYSEEGHTYFPKKDLLERPDDFRVYEYIVEDTAYEPDYEDLEERLEVVGEDGVLFVWAPAPPLKDFLLGTMRLERAIFALADHPKQFGHLMDVVHRKNMELCEVLADSPAQVFVDTAVTGTGMISPDIFERYYLPYTREYAEVFHSRGKLYLNHASGEPVRDILDLIRQSGIDGLYGLSYSSGMKLSEVRESLRDMVVMGGIDPNFIASSTPDEIEAWTKYVLKDVAPADRFILGTADDVPYGTPVENLKAVSRVVEEFG